MKKKIIITISCSRKITIYSDHLGVFPLCVCVCLTHTHTHTGLGSVESQWDPEDLQRLPPLSHTHSAPGLSDDLAM